MVKVHYKDGTVAKDDHEKPGKDFVIFGPEQQDGSAPYLRHRSDDGLEVGFSRAVQVGTAVDPEAEVVRLSGEGPVYEVETLQPRGKGPAKVTSAAYRQGWDTIFGGKQDVGQA